MTLCVRTPFERLLLENDGESREVPVTLATEPGVLGEVDWILLTTKVQDVPSTAPWLVIYPGIALACLLLAFNLIGTALHKSLNVKQAIME